MAASRKSKMIAVFSGVAMVTAILAMKFSIHPTLWILGLAASIPVFSAIVGAVPERDES
jgi:hypothetical protein